MQISSKQELGRGNREGEFHHPDDRASDSIHLLAADPARRAAAGWRRPVGRAQQRRRAGDGRRAAGEFEAAEEFVGGLDGHLRKGVDRRSR